MDRRDKKNAHKILFGKLENKSPQARPGHRWKDCYSVIQCENAFWNNMRIVSGSYGKGNKPSEFISVGNFLTI